MTTVKIFDIEDRNKNGKTWAVCKSDHGLFSLWGSDDIKEVKQNLNSYFNVDLETRNGYQNCVKYHGLAHDTSKAADYPTIMYSNREKSIMAQVAFKGAIELIVAGKNILGDKPVPLEAMAKECMRVLQELVK